MKTYINDSFMTVNNRSQMKRLYCRSPNTRMTKSEKTTNNCFQFSFISLTIINKVMLMVCKTPWKMNMHYRQGIKGEIQTLIWLNGQSISITFIWTHIWQTRDQSMDGITTYYTTTITPLCCERITHTTNRSPAYWLCIFIK